ncbi:MAG: barstar family protein [bacterium]|nr:barstar family protein [bacterium]
MKEYNSNINSDIFQQLKVSKVLILKDSKSINLFELIYFLITKRFRGFVVDDYLFPISDKSTLLEAIYYQIGLIDMYDLNWDALQEALESYVKNNDCGLVIIFRNGLELNELLKDEFKVLEEIMENLSNDNEIKNRIILG